MTTNQQPSAIATTPGPLPRSTFGYLSDKYGSATLTASQFAAETHHHPSHIRALFQRGDLPGVRIGSRWCITLANAAAAIDGEFV